MFYDIVEYFDSDSMTNDPIELVNPNIVSDIYHIKVTIVSQFKKPIFESLSQLFGSEPTKTIKKMLAVMCDVTQNSRFPWQTFLFLVPSRNISGPPALYIDETALSCILRK